MVMAWSVLNRSKQTEDKFDVWADELDEIELVGIDETDPTQPAASDE